MSLPPNTLLATYQARYAAGDLKQDAAQGEAIVVLQDFADQLQQAETVKKLPNAGVLSKLTQGMFRKKPKAPQHSGLYIYGKVGRGKSMLMDMFIDYVDVAQKRRVHFHQFMLEVHARLNQLRHNNDVTDIMDSLAKSIAEETTLLCFDEFHVNNIADAMILGRLFTGLFDAGVSIVSTSNWAPDDLYKNGLQRDRFLPFIDMIKEKMTVFEIRGKTDYRYEQLRNLDSYFHPLNLETTRKLQGIFIELTHDATPEMLTLLVEGRELIISRAAQGIGFFNFDELCQTALGAADYLAIAACLHTVILDGVPMLKTDQRDAAVRFMTLIDTLYEAKVKLFMASSAPIERLTTASDLSMAFQRTISRLMEMQGETYRSKPHLAESS